jgi:hypothetical protein
LDKIACPLPGGTENAMLGKRAPDALRQGGEIVHLEPKAMELLSFLPKANAVAGPVLVKADGFREKKRSERSATGEQLASLHTTEGLHPLNDPQRSRVARGDAPPAGDALTIRAAGNVAAVRGASGQLRNRNEAARLFRLIAVDEHSQAQHSSSIALGGSIGRWRACRPMSAAGGS